MKKKILVFVLIILSISAFAQFNDKMLTTDYYKLYYQIPEKEAIDISLQLHAFFKTYNSYFHFDTAKVEIKEVDGKVIDNRLKVKILKNKEEFLNYVAPFIEKPASSFIYIQYKDSSRCELVGYKSDDKTFNQTLVHYSFIQYLRTFVKQPPLWLEKGFAIYFEKSMFDKRDNAIHYVQNLTWLNTLKDYINNDGQKLIPLSEFFFYDKEDLNRYNLDLFYAESWGLISFLLEDENPIYNRVIWDSVNKMKEDNTKVQNENCVVSSFKWIDNEQFSKDFHKYVISLKTFPELVEAGIADYYDEKYTDSKMKLVKAITLNDKNYIPYYYLGLINYNEQDYAMAEFYYNSAIQMNGDKGLCFYALGVNSFAEQDYEKAVKYLKTAIYHNENYSKKANKIFSIIERTMKLQGKELDIESIKGYTVEKVETKEEKVTIKKEENTTTEVKEESPKKEQEEKIEVTSSEEKVEKAIEETPEKKTTKETTETTEETTKENTTEKTEKPENNEISEMVDELGLDIESGEFN